MEALPPGAAPKKEQPKERLQRRARRRGCEVLSEGHGPRAEAQEDPRGFRRRRGFEEAGLLRSSLGFQGGLGFRGSGASDFGSWVQGL